MATPSRPFSWRFPAPVTLVGAAILFNLPWLEVQCNGPMGNNVMIQQSGWQTATGDATKGEGMEKLAGMEAMSGSPIPSSAAQTETKKIAKAPLMIAFGVLVCAGIFLGLLLPLAAARRWLVALCAAGAMAALATQVAIGFPLAVEAASKDKEIQGKSAAQQAPLANPFGGDTGGAIGNPFAAAGAGGPNLGEAMSMTTRYTPWFYVTWACLAAGVLLVIAEGLTGRSAAKSPTPAMAASPATVT